MKRRAWIIGLLIVPLLLVGVTGKVRGLEPRCCKPNWPAALMLHRGLGAPPEGVGPGPHLGVEELQYAGHVVDDDDAGDSEGNDDGTVTCGETIEFYVDLQNPGGDIAVIQDATISSTDAYVTFGNTVSTYPLILVGGTERNDTPFVFTVSGAVPDGHLIPFELDIQAADGDSTVEIDDVQVERHCAADVSCDGQVDVTDVSAMAGLWRAEVGPGSIYDLDGDGTVTVVDIMLVASQWQSPCP
jgi:hypothetical protein